MRAAEAVHHYKEATNSECQLLLADHEDFLKPAFDYASLQSQTIYWLKYHSDWPQEFHTAYTNPRPSLMLIETAFSDLTDDSLYDIDPERYERTINQLKALLSNRLLPMSGVTLSPASVKGEITMGSTAVCKDAEPFFNKTLRQINSGQYKGQKNISLYHDANGVPILLRKFEEASSALTLEAIDVGDLVIPSGTIVDVDSDMNKVVSGRKLRRHDSLTTYLVEGPFAIGPGRLSAWAYASRLDRSGFAIYATTARAKVAYDTWRGRIVERASIEDFQTAGRRVMTICGVEADR